MPLENQEGGLGSDSRGILFRVLTWVWCFPSLGALFLLMRGGVDWPWGGGLGLVLSAVRLEEWVSVVLILIHGLWLLLWWRALRRGRVSGVDSGREV